MFINSTSLIIPTKDRFEFIKKLFKTLGSNINHFDEIIIVDSSSKINRDRISNFVTNYKNTKIIKSLPSTSLQRNIGMRYARKNNKYIMFCDDDVIFKKDAFKEMNECIKTYPRHIGFGFNLIENKKKNYFDKLKKNEFFVKNSLYHKDPGIVCKNGWHTNNSNLKKNYDVMWLSTQASIFKKQKINNIFFDTGLGKYSYLEDLFFSFKLSKKGKLIICSRSKYTHPNLIERTNIEFGVQEVTNRYKFVKQNKLNIRKFYITIAMKCLLNIPKIILGKIKFVNKFLGNIIGIYLCLIKK